jgi:hypothetical protein
MGRHNIVAFSLLLMFIGFLVIVFNDSPPPGPGFYESIYQTFYGCLAMLCGLILLLLSPVFSDDNVDVIQQKLDEIAFTSEE